MYRKTNRSSEEQFRLFHLQAQHAGQTLAWAIKSFLPDASWGQVNQWVQRRHVQVNGNMCLDPARRVKDTDVIKLWQEPLAKPVAAEKLRLPYIDEHLLVVEKPANITSVWHREERKMPARRRQLQPTLEELLPAAIAKELGPPRSNKRKSSDHRLGSRVSKSSGLHWPVFAVHRLDRDTSGLMLFARTRLAEQKLVAMFRDHRIERQYWAVVAGLRSSQTVRSVIVRDRGDGVRGSLPQSFVVSKLATEIGVLSPTPAEKKWIDESEGQLAVTHVELRETFGPYSIVRCRLETGRTHQIRIHLSELGSPLCGDKTYTRLRSGETVADTSNAPRQALHADRLEFTHPLTGERLEFKMPLPADLKRWLAELRSSIAHQEEPSHGNEATDESAAN